MRTLRSRIGSVDLRSARPPEKHADAELLTSRHRAWREAVLTRAGHRCEATDEGKRCIRAAPKDRMYAHHIRERSDGGDLLDLTNGQCLCASHHTLVTNRNRDRR